MILFNTNINFLVEYFVIGITFYSLLLDFNISKILEKNYLNLLFYFSVIFSFVLLVKYNIFLAITIAILGKITYKIIDFLEENKKSKLDMKKQLLIDIWQNPNNAEELTSSRLYNIEKEHHRFFNIIANIRRASIWLAVAIFYFYENALTTLLGVMTNQVMEQLSIHHTLVGIIASAFFVSYAIMQIPVGWILDKYPVRKIITLASCFCIIGTILFGLADNFITALVGRVLMGIGASFAALSALEVSAYYFKSNHFALLTGLLLTFGSIGGISGQAVIHMLIKHFDFRIAILIIATSGIFVTMTLYNFIPDYKKELRTNKADYKSILFSCNIWYIMIYACLMFGPYLVMQSVWGKPFIEEVLKVSSNESTLLLRLLMIGFMIGSPVFGYLSDFFNKRKAFIVFSAVSVSILFSMLFIKNYQTIFLFEIILFFIGFCASAFLISFTMVKDNSPEASRSLAMGIMNTFNTLGGVALPPLIGSIVENYNHLHLEHPYENSLLILPIITLIAVLFGLMIKETK